MEHPWGAPQNLNVFGRNVHSKKDMTDRLKNLCQKIRMQSGLSFHLLLTVTQTLEATGIFSEEEIADITNFKSQRKES